MMKRFMAVLLASALLCGCGQAANQTTEQTTGQTTEQTVIQTTEASSVSPTTQAPSDMTAATTEEETQTDEPSSSAIFRFAGDFTQAEEGGEGVYMGIMQAFDDEYDGDITKVFSSDLLELMRSADIFMLNNEFTYTKRGTPTPNKTWTFRANPRRVENLKKLGVDCVGLANNHAFDWGEVSLFDTLDTLDSAGIDHVGAGKNIEEAKKAVYYDIKGRTYSIVAATTVENDLSEERGVTRAATADLGGVLRATYPTDPEETLDAIRTAKANSDFCFVFMHWGIELDENPDEEQKTLARQYIDAGADAIIGAHPHILQGIEYYNDKPIIYSTGNYWFNTKVRPTCLFEVEVDSATLEPTVRFHPCLQRDSRTVLVTKEDSRRDAIAAEEALSFGVTIDYDGTVHQK